MYIDSYDVEDQILLNADNLLEEEGSLAQAANILKDKADRLESLISQSYKTPETLVYATIVYCLWCSLYMGVTLGYNLDAMLSDASKLGENDKTS